ncbi:MAG: hypothetical protein ACLU3I_21970 [Acutalibacteraceae bacterium]
MKRCLILMLLLGLLLTGCRKQTQPEQLPTAETIDTQANTEPAAQTPEQTLTLGMIDFDSEKSVLRSMIQSYNFSGAPFRIEILNYADGAESRADAVTRMTTELLAGNVPDLLDCSDLSGAQYAGYAKNSILLPLDGMPDAELLSGILKPCYVDGKLYSIVGAFAIDPLFGPAEKLGASLETSVEDVLLGAVPDVSFFWGGEDLLSVYLRRHAAEQYLDYDTQNRLLREREIFEYSDGLRGHFFRGARPGQHHAAADALRRNVPHHADFLVPADRRRVPCACPRFGRRDGISAGSAAWHVCVGSTMQEAAEEALRNMLQEDFQLTIADAFPVNRAALRELMQKEIEAQKTEQQTAIRAEEPRRGRRAGDLAFLFDEAAADDLMNVLEHADCRSCGNQEIPEDHP